MFRFPLSSATYISRSDRYSQFFETAKFYECIFLNETLSKKNATGSFFFAIGRIDLEKWVGVELIDVLLSLGNLSPSYSLLKILNIYTTEKHVKLIKSTIVQDNVYKLKELSFIIKNIKIFLTGLYTFYVPCGHKSRKKEINLVLLDIIVGTNCWNFVIKF